MNSVRRGLARAAIAAFALTAVIPGAPALAATGNAPQSWGGNEFGQLGNGTTAPRLTAGPVSVADAIDLGSGREHALALRSGGTVVIWGHNDLGQIGDGTSSNRPTPVPVPGLAGVVSVAGGHYHSLALLSNGTVRSWGFNATGQLGDGTTVTRRSPVTVSSLEFGCSRRRRSRHELRHQSPTEPCGHGASTLTGSWVMGQPRLVPRRCGSGPSPLCSRSLGVGITAWRFAAMAPCGLGETTSTAR